MIDIAVVGGGASGYACAIQAKLSNPALEVAVIERLSRTGRKILATGNGRCNLSNTSISAENYHGSVNVMDIIEKTPDCFDFFGNTVGLVCTVGKNGCVYPKSNSASSVVNLVRMKMTAMGIKEICDYQVTDIVPKDGFFVLKSGDMSLTSRRVVICAGGCASPCFGTDGSMLKVLENLGYTVTKTCPAIAPLKADKVLLKGLGGVRVQGKVTALSGKKILKKECGEIQFNDENISGICVFNLAYLWQEYGKNLALKIDLAPDYTHRQLFEYLVNIKNMFGDFPIQDMLSGLLTKNLSVYIAKNALGYNMSAKIKTVSDGDIKKICDKIKSLKFDITGCSPWKNAQATYGGVHAECVGTNLESKLHRGMYFCGEILDTVGDCGGYNLQWAWSSGICAGRECAV